MVYRKGTGKTWYTRIRTRDGRRLPKSTGTELLTTARDVEAFAKKLRKQLDPTGLLDAVAADQITLSHAYSLGEEGAREYLQAEALKRNDTDLTPLLGEFVRTKEASNKGANAAPRYRIQIETLFPARPFLRSQLTVTGIAARLDALKVNDSTRNRYKAAISAFCKFLARRGVLMSNPVREIEGFTEGRGRDVWYDRDTAERVIQRLDSTEDRAREALMCGSGADWSDTERLRVRDIDLTARTVRCHGSKTPWRNREIRITEGWVLPYIGPALLHKLPDSLVFSGKHKPALKAHHAAVAAAKARASTLHDWRHTYAVNALKRGEKPTVVAHQLGHSDAYLVFKRYGRFIPSAKDYQQSDVENMAPNPAPSAQFPTSKQA